LEGKKSVDADLAYIRAAKNQVISGKRGGKHENKKWAGRKGSFKEGKIGEGETLANKSKGRGASCYKQEKRGKKIRSKGGEPSMDFLGGRGDGRGGAGEVQNVQGDRGRLARE